MSEFTRYMRLTFSISFALLGLATVLWVVSPKHSPLAAGFMVGILTSIINGVILAIKTVKVSEYALGQTTKRQGTGQLQRFLLAGLAGFAAVKYPAHLHWLGVVVGLVTVPFLSLAIALFQHLVRRR